MNHRQHLSYCATITMLTVGGISGHPLDACHAMNTLGYEFHKKYEMELEWEYLLLRWTHSLRVIL